MRCALGGGQHDRERRALAGPSVPGDRAAVALGDLAAERQADAGAGVDVARVQPLEDAEDALLVVALEADAVVGDGEGDHAGARAAGGLDAHDRAARSGRWNLSALPIRFCSSWRICVGSAVTVGSVPISTLPPVSSTRASRSSSDVAGDAVEVDRYVRLGVGGDAAEAQQVVDQDRHARGRVAHPPQVVLGLVVELLAEAALELVAEGLDLAQRLLEVVRGDGGELLELAVGALQLDVGALELGVGALEAGVGGLQVGRLAHGAAQQQQPDEAGDAEGDEDQPLDRAARRPCRGRRLPGRGRPSTACGRRRRGSRRGPGRPSASVSAILMSGLAEESTWPLPSEMYARSRSALGSLASEPPRKPAISWTGKPETATRGPSADWNGEAYSAMPPFVEARHRPGLALERARRRGSGPPRARRGRSRRAPLLAPSDLALRVRDDDVGEADRP